LENIGGKRTDFGSAARRELNSPSAITFENNKKIRDQPQTENGFSGDSGGDEGNGAHINLSFIFNNIINPYPPNYPHRILHLKRQTPLLGSAGLLAVLVQSRATCSCSFSDSVWRTDVQSNPNVAADILRHDKATMSYGVYSRGSSIKQMRKAILKLDYGM